MANNLTRTVSATVTGALGMSSDFMGEFDDEGVLTTDIGFDSIEFYPEE